MLPVSNPQASDNLENSESRLFLKLLHLLLLVQMTDIITELTHGADLSKLGHQTDKGNDLFIKTSYALEIILNNPDKKAKNKHTNTA